jgi:hypothetical protein
MGRLFVFAFATISVVSVVDICGYRIYHVRLFGFNFSLKTAVDPTQKICDVISTAKFIPRKYTQGG